MMLMTRPSLGGALGHLTGGDPSITQLQQSLANLAMASGRPAINPGPATGDLNDQTMAAVAASLQIITEQLPSWLYLGLQAAFILGSATSTAKTYVKQYASQLAAAAQAAAAKVHPATLPIVTSAAPTSILGQLFAPGWYKTPFGLLVIGLGAFAAYKVLNKPTPRAA